MRFSLLLAVLTVLPSAASAQTFTGNFTSTSGAVYETAGPDEALAVAVDTRTIGGPYVFVTGKSGPVADEDIVTIKYSSAGVMLASATFAGAAGFGDYGNAVAVAGDGTVWVAGLTVRGGGSITDWLVLRYDADLAQTSSVTIPGIALGQAVATSIAVLPSGDAFVAGYSSQGVTSSDFHVVKYSPSLVMLASATFDGGTGGIDQLKAAALDAAGDLVVVGDITPASYDMLIVKYGPSLVRLASTTYDAGSGPDRAYAVAADPDGNVYVGGSAYTGATEAARILKYGSDLALLGAASIDTAGYDSVFGLVFSGTGTLAAAGVVNSGADADWLISDYAPSLVLRSSRTFHSGTSDTAYAVARGTGTLIYVAGVTYTSPSGAYRVLGSAVSETAPGGGAPPAAPTAFTGVAQSTAAILWTWTDNASDETAYRVMSGAANLSGELAADSNSWLQTGISTSNGPSGTLFVRAVNASGTADSATATRRTLALAPGALSLVSVHQTSATVSWLDGGNSTGTTFELERSSGTGFGLVSSATSTLRLDASLTAGATYHYRVRAANGDGVATAYGSSVAVSAQPGTVAFAGTRVDSVSPSSGTRGTSPSVTFGGAGLLSGTASLVRQHPAGGAWAAAGSLIEGRALHNAALLPSGKVLIAGGHSDAAGNTVLASAELFDPQTGLFSAAPSMAEPRFGFAMIALRDGRALAAGGRQTGDTHFAAAEVYSPYTGAWTPAGTVPGGGRSSAASVLLADGRVLVAGGSGDGGAVTATTALYDPALNAWTAGPSLAAGRTAPKAVVLSDGRVLLAGGNGGCPTCTLSSVEIYDPVGNSWSAGAAMPSARTIFGLALRADGKVVAAGGSDNAGDVAAVDVYDPAQNSWTPGPAMSTPRHMMVLPVVGGHATAVAYRNSASALATTEWLDAEAGVWRAGPSLAAVRSEMTLTRLGDGRILAAGGQGTAAGAMVAASEVWTPASQSIPLSGASVSSASISGTAGLAGATTGYWDVVVTIGTTTARLANAFQVLPSTPLGPTGFSGAAQSSSTILWSWTDASDDELGFRVLSGGASLSGDLPAGTVNWLQTGLTADLSTGPLAVQAYNAVGSSSSANASSRALADAPAGLADSGTSQSSTTISWTAATNPGGLTYQVDRATDGSGGFGLRQAAASLSFLDSTLSPGSTYHYRVRALNTAGAPGAYSSSYTLVTPPLPGLPGAPGTPAGTAHSASSIAWTWSLAAGATSYGLFRASDLASIGSALAGPFAHVGLASNTAYGLRVLGYNLAGAGPLSAAATAWTLAAPPASPAASAASSTTLTLSWGLNGNPGSTLAELQKSLDGVTYATAAAAASTSRVDADLLGCTTYYYRVRNLNGEGTPTAFASFQAVTGNTIPSPPAGLVAESLAGRQIRLSWSHSPTEGITGYRLYGDGGTGTISYGAPLASFSSTVTVHTTGVLTSSASYSFVLRALHRCGVEESAGGFASAGALAATAAVRAGVKEPDSGRRINGNRVTILGELLSGEPNDVQQVVFQYKAASSAVWLAVPAANLNHPNPDFSFPYFTHWDVTALAAGPYDLRVVAYDRDGAADPAPSAVRVIVDPVTPDVSEGTDANGKVKKDQRISNTVASTVETAGAAAADPAVRVVIPAGVVTSATATVSVISNPTITTAAPSGQTLVGSAIKIDLSNGQSALNGTAQITLTYPDTVLFPSLLQIYYLDEATGQWSRDFTSVVDSASRTVTGLTPHFSVFALLQGTAFAADLSAVRVYPVPFKPNGANPDEGRPFTHGDQNSGIIFDNLAPGAEIEILTLAGRRVTRLAGPSAAGGLRWDARNSDGRDAASGAYFAVIKAPGQKTVVKKLVIIR